MLFSNSVRIPQMERIPTDYPPNHKTQILKHHKATKPQRFYLYEIKVKFVTLRRPEGDRRANFTYGLSAPKKNDDIPKETNFVFADPQPEIGFKGWIFWKVHAPSSVFPAQVALIYPGESEMMIRKS